jgi:hypothetical protein
MLLVGLTAKTAKPFKPYLGSTAYTAACVIELIRRQLGTFDIEFEGEDKKYKIENLTTQYLQIYNGKFGGGRIMLNPLGLINDGLMELCFRTGNVGALFALYLFI